MKKFQQNDINEIPYSEEARRKILDVLTEGHKKFSVYLDENFLNDLKRFQNQSTIKIYHPEDQKLATRLFEFSVLEYLHKINNKLETRLNIKTLIDNFKKEVDLQEPLIQLIPKMEQIIMNDLPRYFRLEEGAIQRSDYPALPHKVVREALVNALMHRDYGIHQPTLIVRYRNRLEFNNAGYSLKPLDEPDGEGSVLRNPILARVLYDLEFAETKGTGFQLMQRLLLESGLTKSILVSSRTGRRFKATFLLHQLMSEEHLTWLQKWRHLNLSDDEAKALIFVLEMEAIDNAALRTITDLDTLEASQLLGKLWQKYHLLEKAGSGRDTYYRATPLLLQGSNREINKQDLAANTQELSRNTRELASNAQELVSDTQELPQSLREAIEHLTPKTRKPKLQHIILQLCELRAWTAEALATLLNRKVEALRTSHLTPLRQKDLIAYVYPEVVNHPNQAYVITEKGKEWLKREGKQ